MRFSKIASDDAVFASSACSLLERVASGAGEAADALWAVGSSLWLQEAPSCTSSTIEKSRTGVYIDVPRVVGRFDCSIGPSGRVKAESNKKFFEQLPST